MEWDLPVTYEQTAVPEPRYNLEPDRPLVGIVCGGYASLTMAKERRSFDKVVEEHRELRDMIDKFRGFLGESQPDIGDQHLPGWAASLARRLDTLHDKLFFHFQEEQQVGVLEELAEEFPRAISAIKRLEDEHGQILGQVRATVADCNTLAEGEPPSDPDVRGRAMAILDQLAHHESVETDLMERLHCQDLGVAD